MCQKVNAAPARDMNKLLAAVFRGHCRYNASTYTYTVIAQKSLQLQQQVPICLAWRLFRALSKSRCMDGPLKNILLKADAWADFFKTLLL